LIAFWNQAQIGADVSRSADAPRIVDCGDKSERGQLADACPPNADVKGVSLESNGRKVRENSSLIGLLIAAAAPRIFA
jgi:hypothetical protein